MNKLRGKFIVLVGPDGAGKTTIVRGMMDQLTTAGVSVAYMHGRPPLRRSLSSDKPGPTPPEFKHPPRHSRTLKSRLLSVPRLFKNLVHFNIGYWLRVYPKLRGGTTVIGDRYTYWYLVDPVGTSYFGPEWLARLIVALVPRPDIVLMPWAPPGLIHSRKPELTVSEISEQLRRCDRLVVRDRRCFRLDVTGTPEEAIETAADILRSNVSGQM